MERLSHTREIRFYYAIVSFNYNKMQNGNSNMSRTLLYQKLKYMALVFLVSKGADILDWKLMTLVMPLQNNWSHYCDNFEGRPRSYGAHS